MGVKSSGQCTSGIHQDPDSYPVVSQETSPAVPTWTSHSPPRLAQTNIRKVRGYSIVPSCFETLSSQNQRASIFYLHSLATASTTTSKHTSPSISAFVCADIPAPVSCAPSKLTSRCRSLLHNTHTLLTYSPYELTARAGTSSSRAFFNDSLLTSAGQCDHACVSR